MIQLVQGDITTLKVDAIVNAANEAFRGGGGVDGAIHRAAGPELLQECERHDRLPTGKAILTGGHRLPARYVIHTVGPVWTGGGAGERELLVQAYQSVLGVARAHPEIRSIAFCAISTGIYGYPLIDAAEVALDAIAQHEGEFDRVLVCVYDRENLAAYREVLRRMGRAATAGPNEVEAYGAAPGGVDIARASQPATEANAIRSIAEAFRTEFAAWGIELPEADLLAERAGFLQKRGWLIQYCFGRHDGANYLDYYASHRMTNDRHVRIHADGRPEGLPTMDEFYLTGKDQVENARIQAEYVARNRRIAEGLAAKGFDKLTMNGMLRAGFGNDSDASPSG